MSSVASSSQPQKQYYSIHRLTYGLHWQFPYEMVIICYRQKVYGVAHYVIEWLSAWFHCTVLYAYCVNCLIVMLLEIAFWDAVLLEWLVYSAWWSQTRKLEKIKLERLWIALSIEHPTNMVKMGMSNFNRRINLALT